MGKPSWKGCCSKKLFPKTICDNKTICNNLLLIKNLIAQSNRCWFTVQIINKLIIIKIICCELKIKSVYSFQCQTYRYNSMTNWAMLIALVIFSKFDETITTSSMPARMKCGPFTSFTYLTKTVWACNFFIVLSIYFWT